MTFAECIATNQHLVFKDDDNICLNCDMPADYEQCGDCGFDHSYEYGHAHVAHQSLKEEDRP